MDGKKIGIIVVIVIAIVGFFMFNNYQQDQLAKEKVKEELKKEAKEKQRVQKEQERALAQLQVQEKQRVIDEQESNLLEKKKQVKKAQDLEIQKANDEKIARLNEFKNTNYSFNFASNVAVLDDTQELRDFLTGIDLLVEENLIEKIVINAYADNIGSESYNLKLSSKRAEALNGKLQQIKVEIQTKANGEANPIAPNNTEEGRALNRRIEIVIE